MEPALAINTRVHVLRIKAVDVKSRFVTPAPMKAKGTDPDPFPSRWRAARAAATVAMTIAFSPRSGEATIVYAVGVGNEGIIGADSSYYDAAGINVGRKCKIRRLNARAVVAVSGFLNGGQGDNRLDMWNTSRTPSRSMLAALTNCWGWTEELPKGSPSTYVGTPPTWFSALRRS